MSRSWRQHAPLPPCQPGLHAQPWQPCAHATLCAALPTLPTLPMPSTHPRGVYLQLRPHPRPGLLTSLQLLSALGAHSPPHLTVQLLLPSALSSHRAAGLSPLARGFGAAGLCVGGAVQDMLLCTWRTTATQRMPSGIWTAWSLGASAAACASSGPRYGPACTACLLPGAGQGMSASQGQTRHERVTGPGLVSSALCSAAQVRRSCEPPRVLGGGCWALCPCGRARAP